MAHPALWAYRFLLASSLPVAAPLLLLQARRRGRHWPPIAQRLGYRLPEVAPGGVWVQAVSVGEVAVARPLLAELRRRFPGVPTMLSSTTSTGLQVATGQHLADAVVPFPIDLPGPVRRALDRARPRLVVLVETELWPELLAACRLRSTPVVLANARVSDRSFEGYRAIRRLLRPLLDPVTLVLAQSERDAERLAIMGVVAERIRVVGNVKFDAAPAGPEPAVLAQIRALSQDRPVWVAGSTAEGEEAAVIAAARALESRPAPFLVLAPRHPERAGAVLDLTSAHDLRAIRRSRLGEPTGPLDAVVLDTIGELAAIYQLGALAFVGGSLVPVGGHNPIEPARFGVPVLTGPHVRNFSAVYEEFVAAGAARVVRDGAELEAAAAAWLADPPGARVAGEAGRALLARHAGATARTIDALEPFLVGVTRA
ncbi:MAG: 3-deoxy-D-manno-octulosonic acid transferase [Acidobacteriota bacterium]